MMSDQGWPTPERPAHAPLPRVEDLPAAEQGYDRDSVRAAFEAFYRHAAQLDATLRTLEAVELFQRQAEELRTDLRALRSSSWGEPPQSWTPSYGYRADTVERAGIPPAVWRYAGEVVFLIGVAVALGIAQVQASVIVGVMAAAWLIVGAVEWLAGRERVWAGRPAPQPVVEQPPAPPVAPSPPPLPGDTEEVGWAAFEEAQEPSDAMTIVGSLPEEEIAPPEPVAVVVAAKEAQLDTGPVPVEAASIPDEPRVEAKEPQAEPEQPQAEAEEPQAEADEPQAEADEPPAEGVDETSPEPVEPQSEPVPQTDSRPAAEPEPRPRRRWWHRHAEQEAGPAPESAPKPPRHVRVLPHGEPRLEETGAWERGFDVDGDMPAPVDESAGTSVPEDAAAPAEPDAEADAADPESDALAPVAPARGSAAAGADGSPRRRDPEA
jgi:hypothetical protein